MHLLYLSYVTMVQIASQSINYYCYYYYCYYYYTEVCLLLNVSSLQYL